MSGPADGGATGHVREALAHEHGVSPDAVAHDDGVSPLEWSVNPWRRSPLQAAAGLVLTVLVVAIIFRLGLETLAAAVLAVVLGLSVAPAWLVMRCRVDEQGVGRSLAGIWTKRAWNDIRRVQLHPGGRMPELFVSPLERPGPLDAFRGLHLPLPREADERERLVAGITTRTSVHAVQR